MAAKLASLIPFKSPEHGPGEPGSIAYEMQRELAEAGSEALQALKTGYPEAFVEPAPAPETPVKAPVAPTPQQAVATQISVLDNARRAREIVRQAYNPSNSASQTPPEETFYEAA